MTKLITYIKVCSNCKSPDVLVPRFVNANTGKQYHNQSGMDACINWCPECGNEPDKIIEIPDPSLNYYIFGEKADYIYQNLGFDKLFEFITGKDALASMDYHVTVFDPKDCDPDQVIIVAQGWNACSKITPEEYQKIKDYEYKVKREGEQKK